ncbi:unnamed protein product [Soboliphyme baturini]|uniref:SHSP domain-containing protein n=1 Tax=Soboliphyme baturini TaxID=241478 RepID=A0A183J3C0_9BILA|nr:unnamed protein product [Soboliphyme baturini]
MPQAFEFTTRRVVKVIGSELVIHCENDKYDAKLGNISREVHRSYKIPADVDTKTIHSEFDPKGLLRITAKKKK